MKWKIAYVVSIGQYKPEIRSQINIIDPQKNKQHKPNKIDKIFTQYFNEGNNNS